MFTLSIYLYPFYQHACLYALLLRVSSWAISGTRAGQPAGSGTDGDETEPGWFVLLCLLPLPMDTCLFVSTTSVRRDGIKISRQIVRLRVQQQGRCAGASTKPFTYVAMQCACVFVSGAPLPCWCAEHAGIPAALKQPGMHSVAKRQVPLV